MVISQWRTGRLLWGAGSASWSEKVPTPDLGGPDPPLVMTCRKHKRQVAEVCHLMPNHHNMRRFYTVLVKAGPETRLEVSDPHRIPAQGPGSL